MALSIAPPAVDAQRGGETVEGLFSQIGHTVRFSLMGWARTIRFCLMIVVVVVVYYVLIARS